MQKSRSYHPLARERQDELRFTSSDDSLDVSIKLGAGFTFIQIVREVEQFHPFHG